MKNKKKYTIVIFAVVFILIGIINGQQAQGNNVKNVYNFTDGLGHGATFAGTPEGIKKDDGYGGGVWIGRIWIIIFCIWGGISCGSDGKSLGGVSAYFFWGIWYGYYVGFFSGLAVYGTLHGILTALKWVINAV